MCQDPVIQSLLKTGLIFTCCWWNFGKDKSAACSWFYFDTSCCFRFMTMLLSHSKLDIETNTHPKRYVSMKKTPSCNLACKSIDSTSTTQSGCLKLNVLTLIHEDGCEHEHRQDADDLLIKVDNSIRQCLQPLILCKNHELEMPFSWQNTGIQTDLQSTIFIEA